MKIALSERLSSTLDIRCGTDAGYKAHWKRLENACQDCLSSHSSQSKISQSRPEAKVKQRDRDAKKYWDNPEKNKAKSAAWRAANPEKTKIQRRKYRLAHTEEAQKYRLAHRGGSEGI